MANEPRPGRADVARTDLISWSSIFAGTLVAFGVFVLLSAVGLAAGLEATQPKFGREIGLIISGLFVVLAFFSGGFIAAWTAELDEPESAILHGFLVWGLFVVLLMALVAMGLGAAIGAAGNVFSAAFQPSDAQAATAAAWGSVFALALAVTASILGGLLATRDEIRRRWPFAR